MYPFRVIAAIAAAAMLGGCSLFSSARSPGDGLPPDLLIAASPALEPLLDEARWAYHHRHGRELNVWLGDETPTSDPGDAIVAQINAGKPVDAFIAESGSQVSELRRHPMHTTTLMKNPLVVVAPADADLEMRDLTSGRSQIAVALERTALGRVTRESLRDAGLWSTVSRQVGRFDSGSAIMTRVRWTQEDPVLGVVYRSDFQSNPEGVKLLGNLPGGGHVEHVIVWWTRRGEAFTHWMTQGRR